VSIPGESQCAVVPDDNRAPEDSSLGQGLDAIGQANDLNGIVAILGDRLYGTCDFDNGLSV